MNSSPNERKILDITIRLGVILILLIWSFQILIPFINPVVWGIILAVASYPGYLILSRKLGGRKKIAAFLTSIGLLLLIIVPCWLLADSLFSGVSVVRQSWGQGTIKIPPPTAQVKEWPLIGEKTYQYWMLGSENISEAIKPLAPQLKVGARWMLGAIAGAGFTLIQFIFSIILAGILLARSKECAEGARALSVRLDAERGMALLKDAETTVRNVARGILGVAFIQAVFSSIGFVLAGIPGAGLWALICLILGIIQVGVAPVLIVAVIYLFSTASTLTAVLFLIWSLIVAPLDNILKPLLLGKGAPVPMLVIFLGALGGFLKSGIIGLFIGAVILSLAYELLVAWVKTEEESDGISGSVLEA